MVVFFFLAGSVLLAILIFYALWRHLVEMPSAIVFLVIEKDVQNIEWLMRQVLHIGRLKLVVVDWAGGESSAILEKMSRSDDFVLIDYLPKNADDVFYINEHTSLPLLKKQLEAINKDSGQKRQKQ